MQISAQGAADGGDYLVNIFPIILGLSVATVPYRTSVRSVVDIVLTLRFEVCDWLMPWPANTASNAATYIYCTHSFLLRISQAVNWWVWCMLTVSSITSIRVLQRSVTVVWEGVSWIDVCWQTPERRHWLDTRQQPAVTTNKIPHSLRYMHTCAQVQIENRSKNEFDTN